MFKKFLVTIIAVGFLTGCATFTEATWPQKVTAVEAGYASMVSTLNELREPCVIPVRNNNCLINDELYKKLAIYVKKANEAIKLAKTYADTGQFALAQEWLAKAEFNLDTLKDLLNGIKKVKEDL